MPLSKKATCKHEALKSTLGGFTCQECARRFRTYPAIEEDAVTRRAVTDTTAVLHAILPRLERLEREFQTMDPILQELVLKDLNYSRCSTLDCRAFFPKDPGNLVGGLPYCDLCYPREHKSYLNKLKRDNECKCRRCDKRRPCSEMHYHDSWEQLCAQCNDIVLGKQAITKTDEELGIIKREKEKSPAMNEREFGEMGVGLVRPATFVTGPEDDDEKVGITAEDVRKTADQLLSTDIVPKEILIPCQTWGCQNSFPNNGGNEIDGRRLCDRCYEKELGNVECRSAPTWAWDIIDECLGLDAVSNASDKELRDSVQRAIDAMTVETAWNSNVAGKES